MQGTNKKKADMDGERLYKQAIIEATKKGIKNPRILVVDEKAGSGALPHGISQKLNVHVYVREIRRRAYISLVARFGKLPNWTIEEGDSKLIDKKEF